MAGMTVAARGRAREQSARGRWLTVMAITALHGVGLLALATLHRQLPNVSAPVLMEVQLVADAPATPTPPKLLPPEPPKPKPPTKAPTKVLARPVATPLPEPVSELATAQPEPAAPAETTTETPQSSAPEAVAVAPAVEPAITPPSFVAAYLNNPPPAYPYAAKTRREAGEVHLRVRVSTAGLAAEVRIERSSGSSSLDRAALDVVATRWRFVPARRGGEPVEAWVLVPIVFELRS